MHRTISLRTRLAGAAAALGTVALLVVMAAPAASASGPDGGFAFKAVGINGATTGEVRLTGGGAFSTDAGFAHAGGSFRCTEPVGQGPLAGCQAGEGVHWVAAAPLSSTPFKCTSAASEALKTAFTDHDTVVLRSKFFRAGDGSEASFTANMFVSADDLAPDIAGVQNVWVQNVGCATAAVHFST
jgi:hypothetical protein